MRAERAFRPATLGMVALIVMIVGTESLQAGISNFTLQSFDPPQASSGLAGGLSQATAVSNTGVVIGLYATGTTGANANVFGYELQNGIYSSFTAPGSATGNFSGTSGPGINSAGLALFLFATNDSTFTTISSTNYLYRPLLGTYSPINDPNAVGPTGTFANSINDSGIVTGVYYDAGGKGHGFQYNVNTGLYTTLPDDPLAATVTAAQSTAVNGEFVANYDDASGNFHGALFANGKYTTLNFPGALDTFADGINAFGQISGNYVDASGNQHGFLYDGTTWTTVDYPGAQATLLFYNNDFGQAAGYWVDQNGVFHSLLLTPVPEPSSLALLAFGTVTLAGWRRWKEKIGPDNRSTPYDGMTSGS